MEVNCHSYTFSTLIDASGANVNVYWFESSSKWGINAVTDAPFPLKAIIIKRRQTETCEMNVILISNSKPCAKKTPKKSDLCLCDRLQDKKKVACRHDWHQTGNNVVVTIYAKNANPELSSIEANGTVVSVWLTCGIKTLTVAHHEDTQYVLGFSTL